MNRILLYVGAGFIVAVVCVMSFWIEARRNRRKAAETQARIDASEQAMRDSLKFNTKEEFIRNLSGRVLHSRFITPMVVLSYLQWGTIYREDLLLHISEFDIDVIKKAVQELVALGME